MAEAVKLYNNCCRLAIHYSCWTTNDSLIITAMHERH